MVNSERIHVYGLHWPGLLTRDPPPRRCYPSRLNVWVRYTIGCKSADSDDNKSDTGLCVARVLPDQTLDLRCGVLPPAVSPRVSCDPGEAITLPHVQPNHTPVGVRSLFGG